MKRVIKFICVICTFLLFVSMLIFEGCGQTKIVKLCDYKNFYVDEQVYNVEDEDLNFAIEIKLIENEVLVPKQTNRIVEEFDVVDISLGCNNDLKDYRITIGDAEISENLDKQLLGLEVANSYIINLDGINYVVKINNIYIYPSKITDDIAKQYFDCENSKEFANSVKHEIENHRKFEYAYEKLINESTIRTNYPEKELYLEKILKYLQNKATNNELSLREYLETDFGCTLTEYRKIIENFYDEYMILKTFAELEKITINSDEYKMYSDEIINEMEIEKDEFFNLYGEEYVYYSIYYDKAFEKILKYI